jgi:lactoylglutathione lyase
VFRSGFVNLYTKDINAARSFYVDLLGFVETFRATNGAVLEHVELRLGDFELGLGSIDAARRVHGVDATSGVPVMAIAVWADDADEAFRRLEAAGVMTVQAPHDGPNNNRVALVRDPDGTLIEIVSRPT